ncbi:hypothetical protein DRN02_007800 [Sphingomonas paucimobilis]|uniref:hypothetical protein n=1 Tax=Sphingomonas paucimobilis TaxID=13689 RepID=UPI000DE25682|nr:hypothetical protein [Sphingomonas paucimobilis]QBE91928.1 hypothetical protein DRN02_007800 [Sphingomonas paucimobilis]
MTFTRALLIAFMAAEIAKTDDLIQHLVVVLIAGALWFTLTSDPLPAAVERGLFAFAKRYRNG